MDNRALFLTRTEVTKNLDPRVLVELMGEAFQEHSERQSISTRLASHNVRLKGGSVSSSAVGKLDSIPACSVKVESHLPGQKRSITGLIHLFDSETGQLLAVMESSYVSAVSSALTGALATDLLAHPEAKSLAIVGTGNQGWLSLRFLMEMRNLESISLFDLSRRRSRKIADRLKKYPDLKVRVCDSLSDAVSTAEIILCSTWSRRPILFSEMVLPGAHITTLGSDAKGKKEISAELLRTSSFFCDDRDLAVAVGPLSGLKRGGELVRAELGQILSGQNEGRTSSDEITVYGPVGLPFQDLITSWATYQRACKKRVGKNLGHLA